MYNVITWLYSKKNVVPMFLIFLEGKVTFLIKLHLVTLSTFLIRPKNISKTYCLV